MRQYGSIDPLSGLAFPPDSINTLLIAGSSGQAMDWPGTTASGAAAAGVGIARFSAVSTAGATLNFMVNLLSTHCGAPSSGSSVTSGTSVGSTGNNLPVMGAREFQVPAASTGFSVAALSSGYVMVEVWKK